MSASAILSTPPISQMYRKTENWLTGWDYASFLGLLLLSALVGVYYAIFDRKAQSTTKGYFLGGGGMHPIPVAFSLMSSFISAIIMLGGVAETYSQGIMVMWTLVPLIIPLTIASLTYIPLFLRLELTSIYGYLKLRFRSQTLRVGANILALISGTFYMAIALFTPSLALEAVTGMPLEFAIPVTGICGILYTMLGGIKAVVWADTIQTGIMYFGQYAILIAAIVYNGGFETTFGYAAEKGRLNFGEISLDPRVRHTVWSGLVNSMYSWFNTLTVSQQSVQRYLALGSMPKVWVTMVVMFLLIITFNGACYLSGVAIFTYYNFIVKCDPIKAKYVCNENQIGPYFFMEKLYIPAIPGIYVAALYSGALSSVSSVLNSGATTLWVDIVSQLPKFKDMGEFGATTTSKIIVVIYGIFGILLAFGLSGLEGTTLQLSQTFSGAGTFGIFVAFFLGTVFPFGNWIGALGGALITVLVQMILGVGAYVIGLRTRLVLPSETAYCAATIPAANYTPPSCGIEAPRDTSFQIHPVFEWIFGISYHWYPSISTLIGIIASVIISLMTCGDDTESYDSSLVFPFMRRLFGKFCSKPSIKGSKVAPIDVTTVSTEKEKEKVEIEMAVSTVNGYSSGELPKVAPIDATTVLKEKEKKIEMAVSNVNGPSSGELPKNEGSAVVNDSGTVVVGPQKEQPMQQTKNEKF